MNILCKLVEMGTEQHLTRLENQFCMSIVTEYLVAFEIKLSYFVFNIIVFTQFWFSSSYKMCS